MLNDYVDVASRCIDTAPVPKPVPAMPHSIQIENSNSQPAAHEHWTLSHTTQFAVLCLSLSSHFFFFHIFCFVLENCHVCNYVKIERERESERDLKAFIFLCKRSLQRKQSILLIRLPLPFYVRALTVCALSLVKRTMQHRFKWEINLIFLIVRFANGLIRHSTPWLYYTNRMRLIG